VAPKLRQAMKRPAASPIAGVAKRPAAGGIVLGRCSVISKALLQAAGFPQTVLQVLSVSVPQSLGLPREQRHEFQEQVAAMVGEVLRNEEASTQLQVETAAAKLQGLTAESGPREITEQAAATEVATQTRVAQVAKTAVEERVAALKAAKARLVSATAEQKSDDREFDILVGKRAKLAAFRSDALGPLREGTLAAEKTQDTIAALVSLGKELSFDSTLLSAAPRALPKPPSERGSFDTMVFHQVECEFSKRMSELDEMIAKGELAKNERAAKVDMAASEVMSMTEAEEASRAELEAANTALRDARAAWSRSAKALRNLGPEVKQAEVELQCARTALEDMRQGPLEAFKELLNYTVVPPVDEKLPEEVPAEQESVPEELPAEQEPPVQDQSEPLAGGAGE